jgi:hypothetical protein
MVTLAARKSYHNEQPTEITNPRRTIDIAARHFVDRGHALIGAYPTMAMSGPVAEALDAMLGALAEWRARNPPTAG